MPYGRKRKDGSSKYRDPSGSFGRSVPEFTNDYDGNIHIDNWGQLGVKYAPYYSSKRTFTKHAHSMADSSFCGVSASKVHNEKFGQQIKRRKIALILVVVGLVAIAVAIIPILVITLKPADSPPDKILVVKMNASVDQPFISQYKDESTLEYKSFEKNFTNAMDQIYRNSDIKGYNGFQILQLKNGSIIVIFIIVIEIKHAEDPPQVKALEAVITGQTDYPDDNTYVLVTTFKIRKLSVSVVSSQEVSVNPIPTSTVITLPPTTKSTAALTKTTTIPTSTTATSTSAEKMMSTTSTMEPTTSPATTTATVTTSKPSTTTMLTTTSTTTTTSRTTSSLGTTNTTPGTTSATAATTTFTTTSTSTTMASIPSTFNTTSGSSQTITTNSVKTTTVGLTSTIATTTSEPTSTRETTLITTSQTSTETTTTPEVIYFVQRGYAALIGSFVRLTCVVSGWNGKLNISRISKHDKHEVLIVRFLNNETGNVLDGFTVNTVFSEGNVNVSISKSMSCDDEGTYYCRSGMVGDHITVNREPEIPTVHLPDIMVLDASHDSNYPFVCEGEVEYPDGNLIAEVKKNGTFYVYQSDTESRTNITTDCRTKQKYTFYIKERFTQDWNNAIIRCVSVKNMMNQERANIPVSAEERIRLLPANICSSVANGSNISHPQSNCELFLTCQATGPVLKKCPKEECFSDKYRSCRSAICPLIQCEDAVAILGGSASITCFFLFCGESFSLTIAHSEEIIFNENNISSSIYRPSNNKYIQILIRQRGQAMVNLTLHQVKFNDSGEYIISLDGRNFTNKANLTLKEDTTSTRETTRTTANGSSSATTLYTMTSPMFSTTIANTTTSSPTITTPPQTTTIGINISVGFNMKNYTTKLGTPLQLVCMVTAWNGNLNISRISKLNQSEVNVISFVNNETVTIYSGFAVNRILSESKVQVFISILNMTCDDEGTYYCRSGSAFDTATVKREREKPKLQLPDIMIRDAYHSDKYPFVCEADIENPGEILIAEVNRNGTFYFYEGYNETRGNITADCGKKQRFTFFINGRFTQDWDNAKIRCAAINNMTNGENGIRMFSDEKTIRLLSANMCMGVTAGSNISHPHSDCELFLTCQNTNTPPVLGICQQGQCFYDNIRICRAPKCPFLYCRDTEVNVGDIASITCEIYFCNDSFSLSIKHSEEIVFSNNNISGNISLKSDDKDVQISVTRGGTNVMLTFNKTNCNHIGEYIIDLDRGSFTDRADLTLKVPPKRPTLQLPQSIFVNTEVTITCSGEQGVPQQNMYIEMMFNRGNFSRYDKTTLTTNRQNCSNMGTLVMNFLVGEMWDGARIRCVIGDNNTSRLESDVHKINTISSGVNFSSTELTGFLNDTMQMSCTVNGVFNGDNVIISRSKPEISGEETLTIITFGNATKSNLTGIQISSTNLSVNDMIVHIIIDSLQCHDGGKYFCKSGNRTATTLLEIWRKPNKPKLKLPVDVVSDGYNQGGDPFVCEGNVGYPGGDLIVLFNKDGNFKEAQHLISNKTTGNVTECGRVDRFEFYLNTFTSDLHNSTVRCVATNNKTLRNESAPFDDKVLLLVPGNKCYGETEGLHLPYPYPFYDCGKYLYCSWNRTFVKDGGCKEGECYYTDMKGCQKERTTTTTEPTTTIQPTCPSITCLDAEAFVNSAATINCRMLLCGDDFELAIDFKSKVQFKETMRGNHNSSFLSNAILNLAVKDKTANLNIVFENILCNQSGAYNISIYGGNASSIATLQIRVNPEKPNITAPPNIYKDQKTILSCISQLGIPNATMFWQIMLPGGNFESYSVRGSPDISKSDCIVIGNWRIEVYPEESWNGGGIRCAIKTQGNPSMEIYSNTIKITLQEPDKPIYFVPPSSTGYIGSPLSLTCIARNMTNIMSVKIERRTVSGVQEVASVTMDGTSTTNFTGIRIRSTSRINSTDATIYTDFDNLTCADKGDYFCTIGALSSRGNLSVLRRPDIPQLITFPKSGILENTASGVNCTGEVGYPARKIVFETNKGANNTFIPAPFSLTTVQIEGECSTTYSATFSYTFNLDWNNTYIRCKVDTADVLDDNGTSLHVDRKVLIIPGNICKTLNATYVPHPYACGKYVWCADWITLSDCPATLCHWTVPDNIKACDYTCNDCLDSF